MTVLKTFFKSLLAVPAAGFFVTASAEAATFASADGQFLFENLSHAPIVTDATATTQTLTEGFGGSVTAVSDADAIFDGAARSAFNFVLQETFGVGSSYFGVAEGEARILGDF
ncbi:MAG: hypothetical protein AAGC54_10730, partial [Cyanobacteria bacterium P01_F01_bin.4]